MNGRLIQGAGHYKPQVPDDFGPGPSIILTGNKTLGYFGEMTPAELIASPSLGTLCGYNEGLAMPTGNAWLKCIDNGKVLYISKTPMRNETTAGNLNIAGILHGKEITLLGRRFKVRVLTGGDADPAAVAGGEWSRLMYGLCSTRPAGFTPVLANFSEATLGMNNNRNGSANWCQEKHTASGYYTIRGHAGVQSFAGGQNIGSNAFVFGWRPVLELIP